MSSTASNPVSNLQVIEIGVPAGHAPSGDDGQPFAAHLAPPDPATASSPVAENSQPVADGNSLADEDRDTADSNVSGQIPETIPIATEDPATASELPPDLDAELLAESLAATALVAGPLPLTQADVPPADADFAEAQPIEPAAGTPAIGAAIAELVPAAERLHHTTKQPANGFSDLPSAPTKRHEIYPVATDRPAIAAQPERAASAGADAPFVADPSAQPRADKDDNHRDAATRPPPTDSATQPATPAPETTKAANLSDALPPVAGPDAKSPPLETAAPAVPAAPQLEAGRPVAPRSPLREMAISCESAGPLWAGPIDSARLLHRVARAFTAARQRDGEIHLWLSPPELGSLRLQVLVADGALVAKLETETLAARTALIDNLPALRERLAEQGVRIERFDVNLLDRRGGGMPDRPHARQQPVSPQPRPSGSPSAPIRPALPRNTGPGRLNVIV